MDFLNPISRDLRVIYATALLRSTGVGLTGVVMAVVLVLIGLVVWLLLRFWR